MDFFTTQTDGKIQTALHLFKPQDFSFLPEQQRCRNAELQREVTEIFQQHGLSPTHHSRLF